MPLASPTAGVSTEHRDVRNSRAVARLDAARAAPAVEHRHAQQRVTVDYLDVAHAIARRYHCRSQDADDLRQVAYVGLTKAVGRFDPAQGGDIVAFAAPTIAGEIKRHLRDSSWAVRPPRGLQELSIELQSAIPVLAQRLAREPSIAEIAAETGHTAARVAAALECTRRRNAISLETPVSETGSATVGDGIADPVDDFERADLSLTLARAFRVLTADERRLVHLRFFLDLTQREIAAEYGVSQMQISRRLTAILAALRAELDPASGSE